MRPLALITTANDQQMWVEKDEWQENPDIIHQKFA